MTGYTIFTTYKFGSNIYDSINSFGYTDGIHCGYINSIVISTLTNGKITLYFNNIDDFPFLNGGSDYSGWTANKFYVIFQILDNSQYETVSDIKPISTNWKILDLTDQISDGDSRLTPSGMANTLFSIDLTKYESAEIYDLDYLSYPTLNETGSTNLIFGDEQVLHGTITTDIEALAKVCEIPILLSYDEFNTSTNKTWSQGQDIYISEVGIYSSTGDLVAIGKLSTPIQKNSLISRTIKFEIDF